MASATQRVVNSSADEAAERRRAFASAVGSLRIEGMELDAGEREILERHVCGETDLATMHAQMDACIETDL
jgi:hypothetical protein